LNVNHDGTEVAAGVPAYYGPLQNVPTLSRNDRILCISIGDVDFAGLPDKMPLESSLRGRTEDIQTGYSGEKCAEFIERQIACGDLRYLCLLSSAKDWPESIKASLMSFLKSPNFANLDLTMVDGLTVDLDMLICIVERFFRGDLRESTERFHTFLSGKPAEGEMKDLHRAMVSGGTLPLFVDLPEQPKIERNAIFWTRPGPYRLYVEFNQIGYVEIWQE
uniref:Type VI secretion system baseplate subunit TssK n=1 Tax=Steinernema glaseri TaxID=37863 RepID=A0A1I7ZHS5_9BILA